MSTFTLDLSKFGEKAVANAELVARKIALDMHSRIVERSPVDTGRFRANNSIAIGSNPGTSSMDTDKSGAATKSKAESAIQGFEIGQVAILYNNLQYATKLEMGHSKQAPSGVYRLSFQEVASNVGAYAREVNR